MNAGMNREQRRKLRGRADELAKRYANSCLDYRRDGSAVPVTSNAAVGALKRAFRHMLSDCDRTHLTRLSLKEAAGFPHCDMSVKDQEATPWLAVGIDVAGAWTYVMRWLSVTGADLVTERRMVEGIMMTELAVECRIPGFPVGPGVAGAK